MTDTCTAAADPFAVSRRSALGAMSLGMAAAAAPVAAGAMTLSGGGVREFEGMFPVSQDREVEGLFVVPAGARDLDVVVLAAAPGMAPRDMAETARRLAAQGSFAVVPKLPEDAAARRAALAEMTPLFARMAHASGKVRVVSA